MRITWDSVAKAIYIYTDETRGVPHETTQEITDLINIDWDVAGHVQGIEVIGLDSPPVIEDITGKEG